MVSHVRSMGLSGVEGFEVSVECFLSGGLPDFRLVGLPNTAVREARERVRASAKVGGFEFPLRNITVNLAPAGIRKEGTLYDLPILMSILSAAGDIAPLPEDCAVIGELSLEGALRAVNGVLPMAAAAKRLGVQRLFVPEENAREASLIDGLAIYPARHVRDVTDHLSTRRAITPAASWEPEQSLDNLPDFRDVRGQENVKRALEIAAAGGHNILLIGPPGSGKSMLASRLPSILPGLTREEAYEATALHSVCGELPREQPLLTRRPFRSPHHSVSAAGLAGGGPVPRPGEISLAHNGVLFLDELPEFTRPALEVMRQPLEDGVVTITRASGTISYPASFMLVAAMNPCPCGWHGHPAGRCRCKPAAVKDYTGKISGPLMDRIDMHIAVPGVSYTELTGTDEAEPSAAVRARVNAARRRQTERQGGLCNAALPAEQRALHCVPDAAGAELLKNAFERLNMTARGYDRIVKVARTIADLDKSDGISVRHVAEAIQYRSLDRELGM